MILSIISNKQQQQKMILNDNLWKVMYKVSEPAPTPINDPSPRVICDNG